MMWCALVGIVTFFNILANVSHRDFGYEEKRSIGISIGLFVASLIINFAAK